MTFAFTTLFQTPLPAEINIAIMVSRDNYEMYPNEESQSRDCLIPLR